MARAVVPVRAKGAALLGRLAPSEFIGESDVEALVTCDEPPVPGLDVRPGVLFDLPIGMETARRIVGILFAYAGGMAPASLRQLCKMAPV